MAEEYKVVSTAVIPQLTAVRLYSETIDKVTEGHQEISIAGFPSMEAGVIKAIQDPTHVEDSHSNSVVFVDAHSTNASGDSLRVPVKIIEGTSGRVKSAYFASTSSPRPIVYKKGSTNE